MKIFNILYNLFHKKEKTIPLVSEKIDQHKKDKIIFQQNSILAKTSMECSPQALTKVNSQVVEAGKDLRSLNLNMNNIVVECDMQSLNYLNNLCQFFEISQNEAIARGIWLLSIARDVEVNNKKIGVIGTDPSGLVTDITPINII